MGQFRKWNFLGVLGFCCSWKPVIEFQPDADEA